MAKRQLLQQFIKPKITADETIRMNNFWNLQEHVVDNDEKQTSVSSRLRHHRLNLVHF
jgi:hypothetical protein